MRTFPFSLHLAVIFLFGTAVGSAQVSQADAEKAVRAHAVRFTEAFNKKDAKAVAAFWSENGTWSDPAADLRIEGRKALQENYESFFEESPEANLELDLVSVKVVSDDLAIEEGRATIVYPGEAPSISGYTAIHRKDGDQWLMEHVVESQIPETESHPPGLEELAWLEGEWIDQTETSSIHFENTWVAGGSYLRRDFTVFIGNRVDMSGVEVVGWDPIGKRIRSWVFDSEGGFGELFWRKGSEPDIWVKKASATSHNGEQSSAIHVMKKLDEDHYSFKAVARQRDGLPLPNIDEVTVSRKP
jgi:uncharacterized protein (TIGR02246 family)